MSQPARLPRGRVPRLVEWLLRHRTRVERLPAGSLVFHIGPRAITPEIHERFPQEDSLPEDNSDTEP